MKTNINVRNIILKTKPLQKPLETYVFPVILLLYSFVGVNQGVDITDTMYSLGNYEYLDHLSLMWKISTYLSNVTGSLIMKLPGAGTLMGMNIYCSLFIAAAALLAYYILSNFIPKWMIFIGEYAAISLCWCPRVILYNYMTYLFFTIGALAIYAALTDYRGRKRYLFIAGIFLGLNVMVRFPNVTEAALIVVVWFYDALNGDKFKMILKDTLLCIGGYIVGFVLPLIGISIAYGPAAYIESILGLFGMTEGAQDYTAGSMIASILSAYGTTLSEMAIIIPCVFVGMLMFLMWKDKYVRIKKVIFLMGVLVLLRYYFLEGVFTRSYYYYDSVFEVAMMFIIIGIILSLLGIFNVLKGSNEERMLSMMALIIILITPLGSNNYTYPVLNNMFIVAPIIMWLLRRAMQRFGGADIIGGSRYGRGYIDRMKWLVNFPWEAVTIAIIVLLVMQGTFFRINYSFVDGTDGTPRCEKITEIPKAKGMYTSGYNKEKLETLYIYLNEQNLLEEKVILFGKIPGISYLFDMEPAIFSSWPDLDSYATDLMPTALEELDDSDLPLIIVHKDFEGEVLAQTKYDILLDYMATKDYNKDFENDYFEVYRK